MQLLRSVPEALSTQSHQGGPEHANLEAAYDLHEVRQVRAGMSAGSTGNGTEYSIDGKARGHPGDYTTRRMTGSILVYQAHGKYSMGLFLLIKVDIIKYDFRLVGGTYGIYSKSNYRCTEKKSRNK